MTRSNALDNKNEIRQIDRSDMLSFCVDAPKHYGKAARLADTISVGYSKPESIIFSGMGGSAIGGELLKDWATDRIRVPIEVCRDYSLPAYANRKTLVFVISYSGETEETLSTFLDSIKKKCMIICISSGGTLYYYADKLGFPVLRVPSGMAPRATLPYLLMPLFPILERIGLISDVETEISEVTKTLARISRENAPNKPLKDNFAKTLAMEVNGTIPVIYGSGFYRAVAQRLKTQFNENSKNPAKWEYFSELNHNETVGWEAAEKLSRLFSIILIRDKNELDEIRCRIEATKELMIEKELRLFEIHSIGETRLAKMVSVVCLGDFASVYLAILKNIDPTPVKMIDLLKAKIKKSGARNRVVNQLQKIAEK